MSGNARSPNTLFFSEYSDALPFRLVELPLACHSRKWRTSPLVFRGLPCGVLPYTLNRKGCTLCAAGSVGSCPTPLTARGVPCVRRGLWGIPCGCGWSVQKKRAGAFCPRLSCGVVFGLVLCGGLSVRGQPCRRCFRLYLSNGLCNCPLRYA